jgi:hypothetical protein
LFDGVGEALRVGDPLAQLGCEIAEGVLQGLQLVADGVDAVNCVGELLASRGNSSDPVVDGGERLPRGREITALEPFEKLRIDLQDPRFLRLQRLGHLPEDVQHSLGIGQQSAEVDDLVLNAGHGPLEALGKLVALAPAALLQSLGDALQTPRDDLDGAGAHVDHRRHDGAPWDLAQGIGSPSKTAQHVVNETEYGIEEPVEEARDFQGSIDLTVDCRKLPLKKGHDLPGTLDDRLDLCKSHRLTPQTGNRPSPAGDRRRRNRPPRRRRVGPGSCWRRRRAAGPERPALIRGRT